MKLYIIDQTPEDFFVRHVLTDLKKDVGKILFAAVSI